MAKAKKVRAMASHRLSTPKSRPWHMAGAEETAVAEEQVEEEEAKETKEEGDKEIKMEAKTNLGDKVTPTPNTRLPGMLTHLHSRPVFVTGPSGRLHIFVWNLGPAHGESSGYPSPINEILPSSARSITDETFS